MTALCSGKICTIFPEKGALNFWKACTIALEYSASLDSSYINTELAIDTLKRAVKNEKPHSGLILHSDYAEFAIIQTEEHTIDGLAG